MNSPYRHEADLDDSRDIAEPSREISLGTATILGIFLALALVCGGFFAFGYSLGRRSAPAAIAADPSAPLSSGGVKPAPGSAALKARDADTNPDSTDQSDTPDPTPAANSKAAATVPLDTAPAPRIEPVAKTAATPAATRSTPVPPPPAGPFPANAPIVQVAAVSHQEDADILISALKKRGYSIAIRHEPQDKLLHVQIGPFPSKKEAEVMRQKLLADGYNAIVK